MIVCDAITGIAHDHHGWRVPDHASQAFGIWVTFAEYPAALAAPEAVRPVCGTNDESGRAVLIT